MIEQDKGIGGHHRAYKGKTDDWLTPPHIVEALGSFDLDPCASLNQPWRTANTQYTVEDDGLSKEWVGRVWLNSPYGPQTDKWLQRLADHGDGIALIFGRTETAMFFTHVWSRADAIFFIRGRLHFHFPDGTRAKTNSGGPSVLVAYGAENVEKLRQSRLDGILIEIKEKYQEPQKGQDIRTKWLKP